MATTICQGRKLDAVFPEQDDRLLANRPAQRRFAGIIGKRGDKSGIPGAGRLSNFMGARSFASYTKAR